MGDVMLKKKALRKIFVTTLRAFILLVVYLIPTLDTSKAITTNMEVEYITGLGTDHIYLLDKNNLLVKTNILLDNSSKQEQVSMLLDNLKESDNARFPTELRAYIPENVKVLNIKLEDQTVSINFSKEFLEIKAELEERIIEGISYSILDLEGISSLRILVENKNLTAYPNSKKSIPALITKKFGINKKYDLNSRNHIDKVVVYYSEDIDNHTYYVPVTKYMNNEKEKIEVIVEELSSKYIYEDNLMSFIHNNLELLGYEEKDNMMVLDFNQYLFDKDDKILEEVLYTLSYSVFDSYDVNCILYKVNGKNVKEVGSSDLK